MNALEKYLKLAWTGCCSKLLEELDSEYIHGYGVAYATLIENFETGQGVVAVLKSGENSRGIEIASFAQKRAIFIATWWGIVDVWLTWIWLP
ncbi:unnamed protein product [Allacma fusca]|uniref:Uncharacterized protein n=1 Tax=Allacma fusca TaxID=39272 RepID=A0A8J2LTQ4_9HEXA|nr:unnamed protein product [Allacma fusca]